MARIIVAAANFVRRAPTARRVELLLLLEGPAHQVETVNGYPRAGCARALSLPQLAFAEGDAGVVRAAAPAVIEAADRGRARRIVRVDDARVSVESVIPVARRDIPGASGGQAYDFAIPGCRLPQVR